MLPNNSPIFQASWQRRLRLTRLLLEGGVDVNAVNESGETALLRSILSTHESEFASERVGYIQLLLRNGANPDIQERTCGRTALHVACQNASSWAGQVVIVLLQSGANPMIRTWSGVLPIDEAMRAGHHTDVLQELKRWTKEPLAHSYSDPSGRKKGMVHCALRKQQTLREDLQREKQSPQSNSKRIKPRALSLCLSPDSPGVPSLKLGKVILPPLEPRGSPLTQTPPPALDLSFNRMQWKSDIDLKEISLNILN